ncbi:protein of unknown function [Rhodovastum atsumiense]|uniref:hypothetical protein n=1 Tax=Rhodovastum atsumiense TaxID=504468 RepID=UPI00139F2CE5|nr:hypothetical protein [Rhodovastum atsumiense]CAH2598848.1 protein of unknown function [Rhodovastum atsumiense]
MRGIGFSLSPQVALSLMHRVVRIYHDIDDPEAERIKEFPFSSIVMMLVIISMVGSIAAIGKAYLLTASLCVRYAQRHRASAKEVPARSCLLVGSSG